MYRGREREAEVQSRREVQKEDVEEMSRYCPRTGADIEEQKTGIDKDREIRNKNQSKGLTHKND